LDAPPGASERTVDWRTAAEVELHQKSARALAAKIA
jgi:hypothetical protein